MQEKKLKTVTGLVISRSGDKSFKIAIDPKIIAVIYPITKNRETKKRSMLPSKL